MATISETVRRRIAQIAQRSGFSVEAATAMFDALRTGNGTMAQFNHPDFGGPGQWMRGGMTMVGDMFNDALKTRVDALAGELAAVVAELPPEDVATGGGASARWWPSSLGTPASTGAQNDVRYAYFPDGRRLAIDRGGHVVVYDTADHRIHGFGQQQSTASSFSFASQHGPIDVASLKIVPSR